MAYRFTDTDKWGDNWFCELSPISKLLFMYLCDNCDIAGIYEINIRKICFDIGIDTDVCKNSLNELRSRYFISNDKRFLYLKNFIRHQKNYPLNENNNAHRGILKRLRDNEQLFEDQYKTDTFLAPNEPLRRGTGKGKGKGKGISNNKNIDTIKEPKTFFLNGNEVSISENYHKALDEMQNDGAWIETNTINLRMIDRTLTPDRLIEKIIEFFVLRTNEGNIDTPTTQSMKQHFANWLRQDLSKPNKQLNNEQPQVQRIQRDPHLERMAELRRRATGIGNDNK